MTSGTAQQTLEFRLTQATTVTLDVLGDVERTRALMSADDDTWSWQGIVEHLLDVVTAILAGPTASRETCTTAEKG